MAAVSSVVIKPLMCTFLCYHIFCNYFVEFHKDTLSN